MSFQRVRAWCARVATRVAGRNNARAGAPTTRFEAMNAGNIIYISVVEMDDHSRKQRHPPTHMEGSVVERQQYQRSSPPVLLKAKERKKANGVISKDHTSLPIPHHVVRKEDRKVDNIQRATRTKPGHYHIVSKSKMHRRITMPMKSYTQKTPYTTSFIPIQRAKLTDEIINRLRILGGLNPDDCVPPWEADTTDRWSLEPTFGAAMVAEYYILRMNEKPYGL